MDPAEVVFLVGLLLVFYITIKHPFFVAFLIFLFIIYIRYFAEKLQVENHEDDQKEGLRRSKVIGNNNNNTANFNGQIDEPPVDRKKSQREILAEVEATEPPPKEKFSKLLLTYQVPTMTEYYEGLVQFIQN